MSHTIELNKVSKYYSSGENISMGLSKVDLSLDMGEFVAITGESGSGKSTLLNVISGLDSYEEGEMLVFGEDTTGFSLEEYEQYRKSYIGNIFQDFNLVNSYTVYQNIELVMLICGEKAAECEARILELIKMVGLAEYAYTKVSKLSGGQKQRVAIARALAKNAPIIVADEPTGNLDTESAELVLETLAKVSAERLVVIVTHNYQQIEKYVTRKLTMYDGKIIEDKRIKTSQNNNFEKTRRRRKKGQSKNRRAEELSTAVASKAPDEFKHEAINKEMRGSSQRRLGVRNAFNVPSKFFLLLLVYLFVATAVIGLYSSVKNNLNEDKLLGSNEFFAGADSDRIVLTKKDKTFFSEKEINKLNTEENIYRVLENDVVYDEPAKLEIENTSVKGPVLSIKELKESDISYGRLPKSDDELVICCNLYSDAYSSLEQLGNKAIGKEAYLDNPNGNHYGASKFKICGIITSSNEDESTKATGYSYFYVTDAANKAIMSDYISGNSSVSATFGKTTISFEYNRMIYQNKNVPKGKIFISENQSMYFAGNTDEKSVLIQEKNGYFTSKGTYLVNKIVTGDNFEALTKISKEDYSEYKDKMFMNPEDYCSLFYKGPFQLSVFVKEESKIPNTVELLKSNGYKPLVLSETLNDASGGYNFVIQLLSFGMIIVELLVLFFISYAVIKLIMRSRNSYYATLRILGASKNNTAAILKVELVLMMIIACILDIGAILLINFKIIDLKFLREQLSFVNYSDYIILAIILVLMSLLIAKRYSRKIFTKSAMKTYRGEA